MISIAGRNINPDIIFTATCGVLIMLFSLLLYVDMTGRIGSGAGEKIGHITYKRKVAQRKYHTQVIWEEIRQNEELFNMDTIRTAEESDAILTLRDGTRIDLNENSMILLSMTRGKIFIDFSHGSIAASREEGAEKGGELVIKSKDATISSEKGDVKLTREEGRGIDVTVSKGKALIQTGDEKKEIAVNQKATIAAGSKKAEVVALSLKLSVPQNNAFLVSEGGGVTTEFSWSPVPAGTVVRFELSSDPSFSSPSARRQAPGSSISVELAPGVYYWRITGARGDDKPAEMSDYRKITVLRASPISVVSPSDGVVFRYRGAPPVIGFKWERNDLAGAYVLEIGADSRLSRIVKTVESAQPSIAVDSLAKGEYYWRVKAAIAAPGVNRSIVSPVHRLVVQEKAEAERPSLVSPQPGSVFNATAIRKKEVMFNWSVTPEISESLVQISRERSFGSVTLSDRTKRSFFTTQGGLNAGTYFWRVQGICDDGTRTAYSDVGEFRVAEGEPIELEQPSDESVFAPLDPDKPVTVRFAWKRSPLEGRYRFQVSSDPSFAARYRDETLGVPSMLIHGMDAGEYRWRVVFVDADGIELQKSAVRTLTVKGRLEPPVIVDPAVGHTINMRERDHLAFRWKKSPGADQYEVSLFSGRSTNPLLTRRIAGSEFVVDDLRLLDEGSFSWTVQSFDTGEGGRILRRSQPARGSFAITLGKRMAKPKIKSPSVQYVE